MSEIRVDTIAEKTTANGVSVDGVSLKDGGATLADNLLFNASGKGVYLGVTSATASNLLDDYEEGTFTASMSAQSSGTITSTSTLRYTKIGRIVHVYGRVEVTSASSPTGNARIDLPFVVAAGNAFGIGKVRNASNAMGEYDISTNSVGTSQVNVFRYSATTRIFNLANHFSGDEEIHVALTYETS